jgi:hypothetical protein
MHRELRKKINNHSQTCTSQITLITKLLPRTTMSNYNSNPAPVPQETRGFFGTGSGGSHYDPQGQYQYDCHAPPVPVPRGPAYTAQGEYVPARRGLLSDLFGRR